MTRPGHGEDHPGSTSQPVTTGLADQPELPGAPLNALSLPGRARARRLAWWCGFVLGAVVLFAAYLRVSRTQPVNSDGASNALQAWDMLHGNLLLHGWWLSDVSFYTTELPQYMLVEAVRGLGADVVHVAAAMTYTLLVLLSALLARGPATGREAALRMALAAGIVLAPQLGTGAFVLLLSPDHLGTSVLVLATWLVLDRAGRRWWVPVMVGALLAWGLVGDPLVLYIGVVPLVLVCGVRAYTELVVRRRQAAQVSFELALAAAAGASVLVAMIAAALIRAYGGYFAWPARADLVTITQVPHNVWLTLDGITVLYGASFFGLHPGLVTALVVVHLAGVALAGWAVWLGLRRFLRETSLVTAALTAAVVINLVAFVVSTKVVDLKSAREMVAVLPFGAVLAGRLLARLIAVRPGQAAGSGVDWLRPGTGPEHHAAAGARRKHPAHDLAGRPSFPLRPGRLLECQCGEPGQPRPRPDQGAVLREPALYRLPVGVASLLVRPWPSPRRFPGDAHARGLLLL